MKRLQFSLGSLLMMMTIAAMVVLLYQARVRIKHLEERVAFQDRLRAQRSIIERRQLELRAARESLLPNLDAVAQYRWAGAGDQLVSAGEAEAPFAGASLGVEMQVPVGYRRSLAGVRNAELRLAREKAILDEIEKAWEGDVADPEH